MIDKFTAAFREETAKEEISLAEVAEDAMELIGEELRNGFVRVETLYEPDLPTVTTFRNEMIQAFLNLLANAKDILAAREVADPALFLSVYRCEGGVCASVEDNGGGIDAQDMDRIFEPYYTTKQELNKAGLGLYMAKLTVEEHSGGQLTAENVKTPAGKGARFTLRFPSPR